MATHPSSSNEQQAAGIALVNALSHYLGVPLESKVLELGGDCTVQIDGYSDEPPVICEAYAHIGKLRGSQPDKVMSDALKLLFCEKLLHRKFRKISVFADEKARQYFTGFSWLARCLREHDIEVIVLQLDPASLNDIKRAQERQCR